MNKRTRKLIKKAGFALWGKEPWRPEGGYVDWSSNYDEEVEILVALVVRECAEVAHCNAHVDGITLGSIMKEHFGLE